MTVQTLILEGRQYVILPKKEYERLRGRRTVSGDVDLPPLPAPDADGCYPADEYARASLARKIVKRRWAVGLTQKELARRAGVRPETLNRLERGKVIPEAATVEKIDRALICAEQDASRQ